MEKDIDRIKKNNETDIVIRIDDFGGKRGLTIREFVKSERYTGFTKAGTRIPADQFKVFKASINSIDEKDLEGSDSSDSSEGFSSGKKSVKGDKKEERGEEEVGEEDLEGAI
ncbi:MAG: hypothetical protein AABW80_00105 [Nanoarchaeota archaeon]